MSWDPVWEEVFREHEWGRYPPEELIRFVARNFYAAPVHKDVRILELGCGPGANIWFLAREGFDAYGIDGSETAIANAAHRTQEQGLTANLQVEDIVHLDQLWPAGYFDAVIDVVCLQHNRIQAVDTILQHSLKVLKPNGKIFSMMTKTGSYGDGLGQEIEPGTFVEVSEGPFHQRGLGHFFTLEEVERLFARFSDVQIEHLDRTMGNRKHWYNHWVIEGTKPS